MNIRRRVGVLRSEGKRGGELGVGLGLESGFWN